MLIENGMKLHGIAGLHAKGLLVDQKEAIIYSANINRFSLTSELESHNMEMGLQIIETDVCFKGFASFMNGLNNSVTHQFVLS